MRYIFKFLVICVWLAGIVLAKGFWSTLFACIIPLWAWYLVMEAIVKVSGLI